MAIFKCKMCGGNLTLNEGSCLAECEYCGSVQTVPAADNEKKLTLFSRANRLRFGCEFDKASGVYEALVADFPEEAEAYWGLVLCKYGIEYVDDPATAKKIPTCHRSGFESVLDDPNYKQTLQYSDALTRKVYEAEAKQIEELRKGILEVSAKEEPFDIFICYKETDPSGQRTLDSVLAQDMYDALTEKGYRVFFSRITLEDKLGQEYEPYIFAALNSAKVMLVVGTDPDYFDAVWVRNEWSRYLKLMEEDHAKHLIPCYKNVDAYDMPKEFSKLQAQDMGKVGAMQDLLRGVDKLIAAPTVKTSSPPPNANLTKLLNMGNKALEEGKWAIASNQFDLALVADPDCAEAYVGKLLSETKLKRREDLYKFFWLKKNYNFQKAMENANDSLKKELEGYSKQADQIKKRNNKIAITSLTSLCALVAVVLLTIYVFIPVTKNIILNVEIDNTYKAALTLIENGDVDGATLKLQELNELKASSEINEDIQKKIKEKDLSIRLETAEKLLQEAMSLIENNDLEKTIQIQQQIYDLGISPELTEEAMLEIENAILTIRYYTNLELLNHCSIGDYVTFGTYEQDNNTSNGKEELEWLVLDKKNGKVLIISRYALDCRAYHGSNTAVTWETSDIRKWLNNDFVYAAFSSDEKALILTVTVSADQNPAYSRVDPGNTTRDKVFLLSITEANKYFSSDSARQCEPTDYAVANRAYVNSGNGNCWWWLRSPGGQQYTAANIGGGGNIIMGGYGVSKKTYAVRPAMWIDLSKVQ